LAWTLAKHVYDADSTGLEVCDLVVLDATDPRLTLFSSKCEGADVELASSLGRGRGGSPTTHASGTQDRLPAGGPRRNRDGRILAARGLARADGLSTTLSIPRRMGVRLRVRTRPRRGGHTIHGTCSPRSGARSRVQRCALACRHTTCPGGRCVVRHTSLPVLLASQPHAL